MANRGHSGANPYPSLTPSLLGDLEPVTSSLSLSAHLPVKDDTYGTRLLQNCSGIRKTEQKGHLAGAGLRRTPWGGCLLSLFLSPTLTWGTGVPAVSCLSLPPHPFHTIPTESTWRTQIQVHCHTHLAASPGLPAPGTHPNVRSALTAGGPGGLGGHGPSPLPPGQRALPRWHPRRRTRKQAGLGHLPPFLLGMSSSLTGEERTPQVLNRSTKRRP